VLLSARDGAGGAVVAGGWDGRHTLRTVEAIAPLGEVDLRPPALTTPRECHAAVCINKQCFGHAPVARLTELGGSCLLLQVQVRGSLVCLGGYNPTEVLLDSVEWWPPQQAPPSVALPNRMEASLALGFV
jgi:hypothetical protein